MVDKLNSVPISVSSSSSMSDVSESEKKCERSKSRNMYRNQVLNVIDVQSFRLVSNFEFELATRVDDSKMGDLWIRYLLIYARWSHTHTHTHWLVAGNGVAVHSAFAWRSFFLFLSLNFPYFYTLVLLYYHQLTTRHSTPEAKSTWSNELTTRIITLDVTRRAPVFIQRHWLILLLNDRNSNTHTQNYWCILQ